MGKAQAACVGRESHFYRPSHWVRYPVTFASARGSFIQDTNGTQFLDLFGGMGAISCGHANPVISQALIEQIDKLWITSSFSSEAQEAAIQWIDGILPGNLTLAALCSTGAEAIEQALRLARTATGKRRFITFPEHFHGKTQGAMHLLSYYPDCYGDRPDDYCTPLELPPFQNEKQFSMDFRARLDSAFSEDLAGVVCEPVIGSSGPKSLPEGFLKVVDQFCRERGVLFIVDEVLTGMHRCSGWFVSDSERVEPSILVFGKGLGNGFPVSAIATTPEIIGAMENAVPGSTFSANSLACAAATGVLQFMAERPMREHVSALESSFFEYFKGWSHDHSFPLVLDGCGALLSISVSGAFADLPSLYGRILSKKAIICPSRERIRLMPPLTMTVDEFQQGLEVIGLSLREFLHEGRLEAS